MSETSHTPDYAGAADRQRVWEAAYAAAFAASVQTGYATLIAMGQPKGAFDRALAGNAEEACTVADAAVAQLDDWIANGRVPPLGGNGG